MAADEKPFDNRIEIVTPENIAFEYRVAGPFYRLAAYLLDTCIRIAAVIVLWIILLIAGAVVGLPGLGFGLGLAVVFIFEWFYGGLFETYWNGQTPGKRMMRIRVVGTEGQPITGSQAVLRNVLRAVDGLPMLGVPFYLVGLAVSSANDRFQRLGDWASGTMVVVEEPQRHYGVVNVNEPEALRLAASIPPGFVVSRSLGRALSAYVQRRQVFPWRRRIEIAMHLAGPLREKFDLPANTSPDMLLCALYYRTFIGNELQPAADNNPFALVKSVAVQPGRYAGVR